MEKEINLAFYGDDSGSTEIATGAAVEPAR